MPTASERSFERVVVVVLDSVGCGDAPDASDFDDVGANTLARVIGEAGPRLDNLAALGLDRVARVIARPFVGDDAESFRRSPRRRDLSVPPPRPTALDLLSGAGYRTHGIGKIHDIFAGRGLTGYDKTEDNAAGVVKTIQALDQDAGELVFTNLVDFDSMYGHRRDIQGYAAALASFDEALPGLTAALGPRDCLMITADHGNDPGFRGTDHTRERVPLLVFSQLTEPHDLGTMATFADLGKTILENFGLRAEGPGTSFLARITS